MTIGKLGPPGSSAAWISARRAVPELGHGPNGHHPRFLRCSNHVPRANRADAVMARGASAPFLSSRVTEFVTLCYEFVMWSPTRAYLGPRQATSRGLVR